MMQYFWGSRGCGFVVTLLVASVMLVPAQVLVAQESDGVSEAGLLAASPAEWLTTGRDFAETRYSPLDQIDVDNIEELGLAWSWMIPKSGARLEATPVVSDGVMYATGPKSFVFALDARTGEKQWQWDPGIPGGREGGPSVCWARPTEAWHSTVARCLWGYWTGGSWLSTERPDRWSGAFRRRRAVRTTA